MLRRHCQHTSLRLESLEERRLLAADIFSIELVSESSPGNPPAEIGNAASSRPSISGDGRYVTFRSNASNLVAGDVNDRADVFVKDMQTGNLQLVSVTAKGIQGNGSAGSSAPAISRDGQLVAFSSRAGNLDIKDANGSLADIFVKDLLNGKLTLVSETASHRQGDSGAFAPSLSADGRYVVFVGGAFEGVGGDGVYRKDLQTNKLELVAEGFFDRTSVSSDGQMVAYNSFGRVYVTNMQTQQTVIASSDGNGELTSGIIIDASISGDGRYVAFSSLAPNLVTDDTNGFFDIFVKDLATNQVELISSHPNGSAGDDASFSPTLSEDGRYVAFQSYASNLVMDDTNGNGADVFVHDRATGETRIVSNSASMTTENRSFTIPAISANGKYVAFDSRFAGHVTNDTNQTLDIFRVTLFAPSFETIVANDFYASPASTQITKITFSYAPIAESLKHPQKSTLAGWSERETELANLEVRQRVIHDFVLDADTLHLLAVNLFNNRLEHDLENLLQS